MNAEQCKVYMEQQESDLISRQAVNTLIDELARAISHEKGCITTLDRPTGEIMHDILDLPSVSVAEKVGKWLLYQKFTNGDMVLECSVCHNRHIVSWNYCPSCGARMEAAE